MTDTTYEVELLEDHEVLPNTVLEEFWLRQWR